MEYQICEARSARALRKQVTKLLARGWRPTGGVTAANSNQTGTWWYFQALILPDESAEAASLPAKHDPAIHPEFS